MKSVFLFIIFFLCSVALSAFQQDTLVVLTKKEFSFESDEVYNNPHKEVEFEITFNGPNGEVINQAGYWDGGKTFKVRFSAPATGEWTYLTESSDQTNTGLHQNRGTFYVTSYAGTNDFKTKGWLKVSDTNRFLTYGDGTPFFYLADTAWEMGWKSTREELKNYLENRKSKGFSVIQMVPLSHQYLTNNGRRNRYGEDFFLNEDFSKINPRYFDYIDEIVDSVNNKGMVAAIVPLWGWLNELHHRPEWGDNYINKEESLLMAKYISARYAGDNIIWLIGGDDRYDTPERKAFWDEFARIIKNSTGWRQLATVHPRGWSASYDYFDSGTEWLDFHMYQSSHLASAYYVYTAGRKGYDLEPVKPLINGEPNYEDIFNDLKRPDDEGAYRLSDYHVREASYQSILSGATMGIAYGGNGIWQWHKNNLPGSHYARVPVMEAINFPGSTQIGILKDIMEEYNWFQLVPNQDFVTSPSEDRVIITAQTKSHLISYIPKGSDKQIEYVLPQNLRAKNGLFINPVNGEESVEGGVYEGKFTVQPPDTMDWIFIIELEEVQLSKPEKITLYQNYPNPFNPQTLIEYYLDENNSVRIDIYSSLGQRVATLVDGRKQEGFHVVDFDATNLASGVYFYVLRTNDELLTKKMLLIK